MLATSRSQRSVVSSRARSRPCSSASLRMSSVPVERETPSTSTCSGSRPDAARPCSAGHSLVRARSPVAPNRTKVSTGFASPDRDRVMHDKIALGVPRRRRAVYDYVIVGAGSAGCVLANRLSEDPDVRVLLVEAGPPDTADFIHIPAAFSANFRSGVDWDLGSGLEPGLDDRRIYLPRGKTLGGSSSITAMIYIRGNPADYDEWSELGWGWNDVLPYFLRAEDNTRGASEHHAVGGPLCVSDSLARTGLSEAFLDVVAIFGLLASEDFNS